MIVKPRLSTNVMPWLSKRTRRNRPSTRYVILIDHKPAGKRSSKIFRREEKASSRIVGIISTFWPPNVRIPKTPRRTIDPLAIVARRFATPSPPVPRHDPRENPGRPISLAYMSYRPWYRSREVRRSRRDFDGEVFGRYPRRYGRRNVKFSTNNCTSGILYLFFIICIRPNGELETRRNCGMLKRHSCFRRFSS